MLLTEKKNLIILRAGDNSLHPSWFSVKKRNWDLVLSYYGENENPFPGCYDIFHGFRGSKWQGIHDFVSKNEDMLKKYEQIWLPDDDIMIGGE